jgi:23S rRNA (pseudouridine1915-N3)-methyltransferase
LKFNDIASQEWNDLKPYLDTCLLPVTGLTGYEDPMQVTIALEQLRDVLEVIEIPYKGRVVTYPALHYIAGAAASDQLDGIAHQLKKSGFRYIIVLTLHMEALAWKSNETDLLIVVDNEQWAQQYEAIKSGISKQVQQLWFPVD